MKKALTYLLVAIMIGWTIFPFYWAIVTSLKTGSELFKVQLIPVLGAGLSNYKAIFSEQPFGENIFNSFFVSLLTVILATIIALFASFALGRRQFPGRRAILLCFLFVSMFPQIA